MPVCDRVAGEDLLVEGFFRLAAFAAVLDFFVVAAEWVECPEDVAGDCAESRGAERSSDNKPVRQSAAGRTEAILGITTIMFSLYADFAQVSDAGTTSVTTREGNGRLAAFRGQACQAGGDGGN